MIWVGSTYSKVIHLATDIYILSENRTLCGFEMHRSFSYWGEVERAEHEGWECKKCMRKANQE